MRFGADGGKQFGPGRLGGPRDTALRHAGGQLGRFERPPEGRFPHCGGAGLRSGCVKVAGWLGSGGRGRHAGLGGHHRGVQPVELQVRLRVAQPCPPTGADHVRDRPRDMPDDRPDAVLARAPQQRGELHRPEQRLAICPRAWNLWFAR